MRLGVLATHPIQYYAPMYRALAAMRSVDLKVYFAHRPTPTEQGIGFGVPFTWDVDLTAGYESEFLINVSRAAARGRVRGRFGDYDTPGISEAIERQRFDAFLVHGWNARTYWQAIRACWATRTPVFVRGDSQLRDDRPVKRWTKRAIYPNFMRRFAACLSVGARSDAYFRHYGARRVVRSPHFVDNDAFASAASAARPRRDVLRSAWGVPRDRIVALFAGKLVADKRPVDLINAVRRVPNTHALFVGDGPLRAACGLAARKAGVPVTFAGFQNQQTMPRLYAAADVLVLPSDRRETWGLVVNEAMASGIPVIVSDAAGCVPDLVRDGETGYAYRAGNVRALASALATVAADPVRRTRMGAAAAEHIAGYSADHAAAGVLEAVLP
jgi:glycosyltransferase involved in cell wall biosynthesis